MTRIAIVLSGCGVFDGSEIHESVITMLTLDRMGATYQCVAPNIDQAKVVNHLTQENTEETRNVLVEAARIARGNIKDMSTVSADDFDAVIFPGGFGAASNLCDFSEKGSAMTVQADVLKFSQGFAAAKKPMGFICISPVMITQIVGKDVLQTIGTDEETANTIAAMGGDHADCDVNDFVVDETHKVVSTPAYMLAKSIGGAADGIEKLVEKVLEFLG